MVSSDTARLGIIKRSKFPKAPPLIRYKDVRPIMISYLSDLSRSMQPLVIAENTFSQRAQDSSQSTLRQDDARQSIEVIRSMQGMTNQLASIRFSAAPREQPTLSVSGVELAVRLDLFAHGASRGTEQIGGAVLRLTQDDAVRWTPETGQVAKRGSSLGAAVWPKVRHDQYPEETRA